MDWILDHLQIVIAAAAAVAYWLNQRREAQAEEEPPPGSNFEREEPGAAEEAERARRIREEIRRKIAERSGMPLPPPVAPPPLFFPREEVVVESRPTPVAADTAILERQRKLADQLEALKRRTPSPSPITASIRLKPPVPVGVVRSSLMADLRGRGNLRRAMVLREVLGPPVGLR